MFDVSFLFHFIGNFSDPRPPEEADMIAEMAQSQLLDTSVHDNDPATTDLLMQLFLSDLTPEEELNKLGCGLGVATTTPPTMLDVDREQQSVNSTVSSPTSSLATVPQLPSPNPLMDSGICSEAPSPSPSPIPDTHVHTQQPHDHGNAAICDDVISVLMTSASPLECTDSNGFSDPLDNPFLTESTDLSDFLQDPSVSAMLSSSSNTHTPSPPPSHTTSTTINVCNSSNDSDTTPFPLNLMSEFCLSQSPSNTDVHVNLVDARTHNHSDLNLFDLSQNASLLPPSFDATEVENLDIDFSTFCADTFSLLPTTTNTTTTSSDNDSITSEQLSVMLTQAAQQQEATSTSSTIDVGPPSVSNSNCDDVFMESSPSPSTSSDQLSVVEPSVESPKTTKSRKRQASDLDLDSDTGDGESAPDAKKTKFTRRQKNNVASQVSRAKRKAKNTAMFDRVGELESENAMLRIKEKELTNEIERLKSILVHRLSK